MSRIKKLEKQPKTDPNRLRERVAELEAETADIRQEAGDTRRAYEAQILSDQRRIIDDQRGFQGCGIACCVLYVACVPKSGTAYRLIQLLHLLDL